MRRDDLVMWYLEEREDELSDENLLQEQTLIQRVIKRLIHTVSLNAYSILVSFFFNVSLFHRVKH
jgi:hypothetical protein